MNNFKYRSRNRRDSPRRDSGGGDSRRFSLHDAVCDECGKDCRVPFKPSNEKPIYCSNCFEKKGGRDKRGSNRSGWKGSRKRNFGDRGSGRSSQNNISNRSISQLIVNIEILNTKLGTIINLLSSTQEKKSELTEGRTEKKKSKSTKADKTTEKLPTVKDKDTDLTADNAQENIIFKPKKKAKTTTDSQPKTESKVEEKPHPSGKSKSKKEPQSDKEVNPDNESSEDQNTEKKKESQLEAKAKPEENSKKPTTKS